MNDTSLKVAEQFQYLLMQKKPEERLRMGCSMFEAAKVIAKSSILAQFPAVSSADMKKKIFLRFYKQEFSEIQREKILNAI